MNVPTCTIYFHDNQKLRNNSIICKRAEAAHNTSYLYHAKMTQLDVWHKAVCLCVCMLDNILQQYAYCDKDVDDDKLQAD